MKECDATEAAAAAAAHRLLHMWEIRTWRAKWMVL